MLNRYNEVESYDSELICINDLIKQDSDPHGIGSGCLSLFKNALNSFIYCKTIFENSIPTDFVFLEVNPAFEKLTGMKNVRYRELMLRIFEAILNWKFRKIIH